MEITYRLETKDYIRYAKAIGGRDWRILLRLVISVILALFLLLFFVRMPGQPATLGPVAYVGFVPMLMIALTILGLPVLQGRAMQRQVAMVPGALGVRTLRMDPTGFVVDTEYYQTSVRWIKIADIRDTPDLILLMLGPRYGHIIPKNAFPDAEQARVFLEAARSYRQGALSGMPVQPPGGASVWPPPPRTQG